MLQGALVRLRARQEADVATLDAELHDDLEQAARATRRPWRPISPRSSASDFAISEPEEKKAEFSVVTLDGAELVGSAGLWGIDMFNRLAHIGVGLRPAYHGKGLGTDTVGVLCHYAFVVLGLHRLQVDTSSGNHAMLRAAERNGFVREGVLRQNVWCLGDFADEVLMGLLADEWTERHAEG